MNQHRPLSTPLRAALSVVSLACAALLSTAAQARIVNGDFANGLAGWSTAGDASAQAANASDPTHLWLTTASTDYQDDADSGLPAGARNASGTAATYTGAPGGLEDFAGVPLGAFDDAVNGAAYEGSAASQSFTAAAGSRLSFDWDFGTLDPRADAAFVVIDGRIFTLATSADATRPGTDGNATHTGWTSFSGVLAGSGAHTVTFGVVDIGDYDDTSTLAVSGVDVSAVPETSTAALLLAGAGVLAMIGRRRKV
jgi:hypothetical protein